MESDPEPRPRPRLWLRWLTVIGLLLAVLVWLLFRDEALEPADDLLPQRPSAAGVPEEQNGWVQWQKVCESLPEISKEERARLEKVLSLGLPAEPERDDKFAISDEALMRLEEALRLPVWKNTEWHTQLEMKSDDNMTVALSRLDARLFQSIRLNRHDDILRLMNVRTQYGRRTTAGGTSYLDLLKGMSAGRRLPVLLALVDFTEAELKSFADGFGDTPYTDEDLAEVIRHHHRMVRNLFLDQSASELTSSKSLLSNYFFKRDATVNFIARIYRSQINAAIAGRYPPESLLEEEEALDFSWTSRLSPNRKGRALAASLSSHLGTLTSSRSAEHRCVRVLVALHRHWKATGVLPDDLSVLVPRYLPAVPADPYAPGQPLGWDKVKRVVYSVGPKKSTSPPDFSDKGKPSAAGWFKMVAPGRGVRFRRPEEGPDVPVN